MTKLTFLIRDRGGQLTDAFDSAFTDAGLQVIKSPPGTLKANAHCARIIGTLRRELLDSMLILNEQYLRRTLTRYLAHYNTVRLTAPSESCPPAGRNRTVGPYRPCQPTSPPQSHPRRPHQRLLDRQLIR